MKRAISLGCALLAGALAACQQTLVLDDRPSDGGLSGTGGSGVGPSDASSDGQCGQAQLIQAYPDVPQVIVALDRSLMTTETALGPQDEFSTAAADLSTDVSHYQPSSGPGRTSGVTISFAYLAFPDTMGNCDAAFGCCSSDVIFTPTSTAFQTAAYACNQPGTCISSNNRPIAAALSTAYQTFFEQSSSVQIGPRFILLVSGGPPSGGCSSTNDCQNAINKIDDLNALNVTTYVVGMGDQTNDGCLQSIANEVGSAAVFYSPATSSNDLAKALEGVTGEIAQAACHMTLSTTSNVSGQLTVYDQGMMIPPDYKNGWSLDTQGGASRLILHGNACQNFTMNGGISGLQVYAGCGSGHFGGNP